MLYTAITKRENSFVQRVSIASSNDLLTWKKHPEVVVEPDPRWYIRDPKVRKKAAFRDPFPWVVNGRDHATIT